jgi:hypothetical protein
MITIAVLSFFFDAINCRNAILGFATGYDLGTITKFVVSARRAHYDGELWLGIYSNQQQQLTSFSRKYGVRLMVVDGEDWTDERVVLQRYRYYERWTHAFDDPDWLLTSDVRDAFFQRNPFARVFVEALADINLFNEAARMTVGTCPFNSGWVRDCWGEEALQESFNHSIICGGNILARARHMRTFIREMFSYLPQHGSCAGGEDQGVLNYMNTVHRWYTAQNKTVRVWPQGTGSVNTIGYARDVLTNAAGFVINLDGQISALIHQYDRHASVDAFFNMLHNTVEKDSE